MPFKKLEFLQIVAHHQQEKSPILHQPWVCHQMHQMRLPAPNPLHPPHPQSRPLAAASLLATQQIQSSAFLIN